jgi:hypothetical protein
MPSEEEITRLLRLIRRVSEDFESLTSGGQAAIHDAVTAVRKTRQAASSGSASPFPMSDRSGRHEQAQPPQRG